MKVHMYYLKSSDRLFAMTRYKELSDEFELVYDMTKFYKITENWDDEKEYTNETRKYTDYKLWFYTLHTKGMDDEGKTLSVCMTEGMRSAITKAISNIRYTYKSAYIACLKMRETEGVPIKESYLNSLYCLGNDEKHLKIDEYIIWMDLYGDIISVVSDKKSEDTSIAAARLLGIYKYDNQYYELSGRPMKEVLDLWKEGISV